MSGSNSSARDAAPPLESPVALTVHSLPDPALSAQKRRGRWGMLMVIIVCAAPVIASYFSFYVLRLSGNAYGELIMPTVDMPAQLSLTDLAGQPVAAESLKGQWLLTVVQEAGCDAGCEKQLYAQRQLREMLGKERDKLDKLWLIPSDGPDAPPLRPELQQAVSQGVPVTVLRAPRAQIEAWLKPGAGHALAEHFYLIDPMGRWMLRSPAAPDPSKVKKDLDRLLKANAGWDRPGR
ncbi:SCO family protein [Roseateles violae]|uniref:Cytochrome oxidase Cu insertion factor (SCO1/SenC/PrrC family) n=1 Tax=Roseateles violae TaxID=3058042 RepID=A0ABT8DVD3_9BURK|nr:hypothetical protein [Pelomonas sp. PFR6]MDN3921000.1 hypothetical protein [Pelomonas sp. PFR6]